MRLRLKQNIRKTLIPQLGDITVEFLVDESSPCCGENRADWKVVDSCRLDVLIKAVLGLAEGKHDRIDI